MRGNFNQIINDGKLVLVDFHAEWCGPCKLQTPVLSEVSAEAGDKVRIIKIDVDKNQTIAQRFQVRSVPTLILFKNGKPVWQQSGVASKQQLINLIHQNN
jgi:thioredoxin 1